MKKILALFIGIFICANVNAQWGQFNAFGVQRNTTDTSQYRFLGSGLGSFLYLQSKWKTDQILNTKANKDGSNATGTWSINISGAAGRLKDLSGNDVDVQNLGGTLISSEGLVNITGSADKWGGYNINWSDENSNMTSVLGWDANISMFRPQSLSIFKDNIGLNNGSTLNNKIDGSAGALHNYGVDGSANDIYNDGGTLVTNAGVAPVNITGSAVKWGNRSANWDSSTTEPVVLAGKGVDEVWKIVGASTVKSFLGLPSTGGYDLQDVTDRGSTTTNTITIATPTANNHAATKKYVDDAVAAGGGGGVGTLQQVTNNGSTTTNHITVGGMNSTADVEVQGTLDVTSSINVGVDLNVSGNIGATDISGAAGYLSSLEVTNDITVNGTVDATNVIVSSTPTDPADVVRLQDIGGGVILKGSASFNLSSIPANSSAYNTITVSGASVGDVVSVGIPYSFGTNDALIVKAFVSGSNTVGILVRNVSGTSQSTSSETWKVRVFK